MSLPRTVAEILTEHVTLEVEGIDRMYLNVYVPQLQRELGVATFFRFHRGHRFASSALMDPISKSFVAALEEFARRGKIPVIHFRKGQRKDDIAAEFFRRFTGTEGVVFIGKAQEKTPVFRTERRRNEKTGATYPCVAAIPNACRPSVTASVPRRSTLCCANGCGCCRIPTPAQTAGPAIVTMSRFSRPSSRSFRCWTGPSPAASSSRR